MSRPIRLSAMKWAAGTAASPSAAASYRVEDPDFSGIEQTEIVDNTGLIGFAAPYFGEIGKRWSMLRFAKFLNRQTASGSVYSPPSIGALLRASGFGESLTGDGYVYTISTNLQPYSGSNTTGYDAIDLTWNRGVVQDSNLYGLQEILKDGLANPTFTMRPGQPMRVDFDFVGRINSSTASSTTAMATDTTQTAIGTEGIAGTTTAASCALGGVVGMAVKEIVISLDNGIDQREDLNGDIGGYSEPAKTETILTGSILIEEQLLATFGIRDKHIARTSMAFTVTHDAGAGVGNECVITGNFKTAGDPKGENVGRIACVRIPIMQTVAIPAALTTAFKLTYKGS